MQDRLKRRSSRLLLLKPEDREANRILRMIHKHPIPKSQGKIKLHRKAPAPLARTTVKAMMAMKWTIQKETWTNLMKTATLTRWPSSQVSKK